MKNQSLMTKQVDTRLARLNIKNSALMRPEIGWVKMIRKALGMTAEQLASRMRINRSRIIKLEQAEMHDAVTLRSLRKAAAAMNCELVYAIVPSTTLQDILQTQAELIADKRMKRVAHSMALENQGVSSLEEREQFEKLVNFLLSGNPKNLWEK